MGMKVVGALVAASLLGTLPAAARAAEEPSRATLLDELTACQKISDRDGRLDCFDRKVAELDHAERDHQIAVVDNAQLKEAKRSLFGLRLPQIKLFSGAIRGDEEVSTIRSTITSIHGSGSGGVVFTIADGATWKQDDDEAVAGRIDAGTPVIISRGAMGSYFATIGRRPGIRVHRVN